MFRHYRVIFRQLVFITSPTYIKYIKLQLLVIQFKLINPIIIKYLNLNCATNSCNWYTYVTWRGNEYELPENDMIVSKHVGAR